MAFDVFMVIPTKATVGGLAVVGESTDADADFKDKAFEIDSFSWGASNSVTIGSGTGGTGGGKVNVSSFNVMKKTDAASPALFKACADGSHFPTATVTLRKAGGDQLKYLKYEFTQVFVESVQWSGSSGGQDTPSESVSFAFGGVTITYQPQDETGKIKGTKKSSSWDVRTNTGTTA